MSFLTQEELEKLNFKKLGKNVLISNKASFYGCEYMEIGDNVRIDDFCVLSGKIILGKNIHISTHCILISDMTESITIQDYSTISFGCRIFNKSDDFSGNFMSNPTVPSEFTNVMSKSINIEKHVIIGTSCIIMPGVTIEEGAAIGAASVVRKDLKAWNIYYGNPIKKLKERSKRLLDFENLTNKH